MGQNKEQAYMEKKKNKPSLFRPTSEHKLHM